MPTHCHKYSVPYLSICEASCTSQGSCIGYYYNAEPSKSCNLITSTNECPFGFVLRKSENTARKVNDLVPSINKIYRYTDYRCYGKISDTTNTMTTPSTTKTSTTTSTTTTTGTTTKKIESSLFSITFFIVLYHDDSTFNSYLIKFFFFRIKLHREIEN